MVMNPDAAFDAYDYFSEELEVEDDYFCEEPEEEPYIDSAFRSSSTNEVYFFLQDKYMRLYYTPGQQTQTDDKILRDLDWICYDFPSLEHSSFSAYGISCSFDTEDYKAYIFSECYCVYLDYANHKILSFSTIGKTFPVLKNTVFEQNIDSAFRSSRGQEVYLIKGNKYCCLDYDSKQLIDPIRKISEGFPILKGTIFENGIDACFASHKENEAYLFKGENYVLINFIDDTLVDDVKPIVNGWSSLKGILPLGDPQGDPYPQKVGTNRYHNRSVDDEEYDEEQDEL